MIDIQAGTVMDEQEPTIQPDCTITKAASQLREPDVPALLVQESSSEIVGIVTESDIVATVAEEGFSTPVETCMSSPVETIPPETPIGLAADRMRDTGVSLLPVVDGDETYLGLVTQDKLAPYLSRQRLEITWDGEPLRIE